MGTHSISGAPLLNFSILADQIMIAYAGPSLGPVPCMHRCGRNILVGVANVMNDDGIRLAGNAISEEEWTDPVVNRTDLPIPPRTELSNAL